MFRSLAPLAAWTLLCLALSGAVAEKPSPPAATAAQLPIDAFGDPLPAGAIARLGTVRFRHGNCVTSVAFSPDSKILVSAGMDNTTRFWGLPTGKELRRLKGAQAQVSGVASPVLAFSPDGKKLAIVPGDGSVRLVDTATGKEQRHRVTLGVPPGPSGAAFSPDGKMLAVADNVNRVFLWETGNKTPVRQLSGLQGPVRAVACSPDGAMMATGDGSAVRLWDAASGKPLRKFRRHQGIVTSLAFAPGGRVLASVADEDATVRLWDVATGHLLHRLSHRHTALVDAGASGVHESGMATSAVAFAPDGKTLVSCGKADRMLRLWNVATGEELRTFEGYAGGSTSLALSPDGNLLAAGAEDNAVRLWDVANGKELHVDAGHRNRIYQISFAADGKTLISGARDGTIRVWDMATCKTLRTIGDQDDRPFRIAVSPDGRLLATGRGDDEAIFLWDLTTGKERSQLNTGQSGVTALAFSTDGKILAAMDTADRIRLWDGLAGKLLRDRPYPLPPVLGQPDSRGGASSMAFAPDGKSLAAIGQGPSILVYDTTTSMPLRKIDTMGQQGPFRVLVAPDGRTLATAANDNTVCVWSAATGRLLHLLDGLGVISRPEGMMIWESIAYSPDSRLLATLGQANTVRVWEIATGKELGQLKGHQGWGAALAFSPDGRTLATGSLDTTILLWDLASLAPGGRPPRRDLARADMDALWADLAGNDAAAAYRALWTLAAAPSQSVPWLRQRLHPAAGPDAAHMTRLIADLDNDQFALRQKATRELEGLGELAEPALRKALAARPSVEARRCLQRLLEAQANSVVPGGSLADLRALAALEHAGTGDARELIRTLASGEPAHRLTQEAKASLDRLNARSSGSRPIPRS
jgi:WD40 repeat protein